MMLLMKVRIMTHLHTLK